MTTKMSTRLQRIEAREAERLTRWLNSLSNEELLSFVTDKEKAAADLALIETLSNEQLIRIANGELLSSVLGTSS